MNANEKAARQAKADALVSDIYERIGPGKGLTVRQVNYLFSIMQGLVQGKQAGGARGTFRWSEASGTLYDPEGEDMGTWYVKTYPNGNGAATLTVNRKMTRDERAAEVARLEAEREDFLEMNRAFLAINDTPERRERFDQLQEEVKQSFAVKIENAEHGYRVL